MNVMGIIFANDATLGDLTLNRTMVDAQKARAVLDDLIDANQRYWPELK